MKRQTEDQDKKTLLVKTSSRIIYPGERNILNPHTSVVSLANDDIKILSFSSDRGLWEAFQMMTLFPL